MNKRQFIKRTTAAMLGLSVAGSIPLPLLGGHDKSKDWIWLRPQPETTTDEWHGIFSTIKSAGIDAVFAQVYDGANPLFEHDALESKALLLEKIIPIAHEHQLELHGWMWTMICNNKTILKEHKDWYAVNRKGQSAVKKPAYVDYYKFLCPRHPEVKRFVQNNVKNLANVKGLDGVHLDYVRQPDVILAEALQPKYNIVQDKEYPEYDYCYSDICREEFKAKSGIDPLKDLEDPAAHQEWRQFRYDGVSELVNGWLVPEARKQKKFISAAVFPNWESVRQEWFNWNLDAFFPMLYHNFYNKSYDWIFEQTKHMKNQQKYGRKIYSGLFVPKIPAEDLNMVRKSCLKSEASGVSYFDFQSFSEAHFKNIKK